MQNERFMAINRGKAIKRIQDAWMALGKTRDWMIEFIHATTGDDVPNPADPLADLSDYQLEQVAEGLELELSRPTYFDIRVEHANQEQLQCIVAHAVALLRHMTGISATVFDGDGNQIKDQP